MLKTRRFLPLLTLCLLLLSMQPTRAADPPFGRLSIIGRTLLDDGKPVRGLMALWHIPQNVFEDPQLMRDTPTAPSLARREMRVMKNGFGLMGFGTEVGWNEIEAERGVFRFSPQRDRILEIARQEGLYATIFLTPHYTPDWAMNPAKNGGLDVHNKNEKGENATGLWLNYAPASPAALVWQGEFQRRGAAHFSRFANVIGIHLTNELAYGSAGWLDYSQWAQAAWKKWRAARVLASADLPQPSAASTQPQLWLEFQLFRQEMLANYFNAVLRQAKAGLPRGKFVPIYHRHNWYASSDAYASQHGNYLDPNLTGADSTGGNVYGVNEIMAGMMLSWNKPLVLTETSSVALQNIAAAKSVMAPGAVNAMFLTQFFQGAGLQTIYQFGVAAPGGQYEMRISPTQPLPEFAKLKNLAAKLALVHSRVLALQSPVGYLWPRRFAAVHSDQHWNLQTLLVKIMSQERRSGATPVVIYPSFFAANAKPETRAILAQTRLLYATRHFGMDQATLDGAGMEKWVRGGGTLFVELDGKSKPPSWLHLEIAPSKSASFSTATASPFGAERALAKGDGAWQLTPRKTDQIWATWDGENAPALLSRRWGAGRVVVLGSAALNRFPVQNAMNELLRDDADLDHTFSYYRLGNNVLVMPTDASSSELSIPRQWLGASGARHDFSTLDLMSGEFAPIAPVAVTKGYRFALPKGKLLLLLNTFAP